MTIFKELMHFCCDGVLKVLVFKKILAVHGNFGMYKIDIDRNFRYILLKINIFRENLMVMGSIFVTAHVVNVDSSGSCRWTADVNRPDYAHL